MTQETTQKPSTPIDIIFKKWFGKKRKISVDDIGVYKYIFLMDTVNEASHSHKYNIFTKIKAVHVYDELVEAELVDFHVNEPMTEDVLAVIKKNFPKYINPKLIQWEIKEESK